MTACKKYYFILKSNLFVCFPIDKHILIIVKGIIEKKVTLQDCRMEQKHCKAKAQNKGYTLHYIVLDDVKKMALSLHVLRFHILLLEMSKIVRDFFVFNHFNLFTTITINRFTFFCQLYR